MRGNAVRAVRLTPFIDFAAMTNVVQIEASGLYVEFIKHAIITNA